MHVSGRKKGLKLYLTTFYVPSSLGLPRLYLPFAFTILHESGRLAKKKKKKTTGKA